MAACPDQEPLLMARVDGSLELPASRQLEQHLRSCAGCREQLAELEDVLGAVALPAFSSVEEAALVSKNLPRSVLLEGRRQKRARRVAWQGGLGAALAASLCLTVGIGLGLHHRPGSLASGSGSAVGLAKLPAPATGIVGSDETEALDELVAQDPRAAELAKEDVAEDSSLYDAVAFEDDDAGLDDG